VPPASPVASEDARNPSDRSSSATSATWLEFHGLQREACGRAVEVGVRHQILFSRRPGSSSSRLPWSSRASNMAPHSPSSPETESVAPGTSAVRGSETATRVSERRLLGPEGWGVRCVRRVAGMNLRPATDVLSVPRNEKGSPVEAAEESRSCATTNPRNLEQRIWRRVFSQVSAAAGVEKARGSYAAEAEMLVRSRRVSTTLALASGARVAGGVDKEAECKRRECDAV